MIIKINKIYINFLLISFFPLWILGPAICDILVSIGAILGLINYRNIKYIDTRKLKFIKTYIYTLFLYFFITLYNNYEFNFDRSFEFVMKSLFDMRFPLFCLLFITTHELSIKSSIKYVSISILSCLLFIFIETYTQLLFKFSFFGFDSPYVADRQNFDIERISGPFVDELILGTYLSKLILPITLFLNFSKNKYIRHSSIPIFLLTSFLIVNTGEKNALVNLMLISLIFPFLIYKNISVKYRLLIIYSMMFVMLIVANLFFPKQFNRYFYLNLSNFGFDELSISLRNLNGKINYEYSNYADIDQTFDRNFLNTEHGALIEKSLFLINNNLLIGLGRSSFKKHCDEIDPALLKSKNSSYCSTHPHNYILETLNNYGLVGLLLLYYCLYHYVRSFSHYNKNENDPEKNILYGYFITIIILLFPFNLTTSFYSNYTQSIFWFILSLSLLYKKESK